MVLHKESSKNKHDEVLSSILSCGFHFFTALRSKRTNHTKRKAIEIVLPKLGTTEWAFDIDFLYQLRKSRLKVKETPTKWKDNRDTKLNLKKTPFKMFSSLVRLRLKNSPFKFIVKLYDKLPENRKIHNW